MKQLYLAETQQIAAGSALKVNIQLNVPTAEIPLLSDLFVDLFTDQLNSSTLAQALSTSAEFNAIQILSIGITFA